MARTYSQIIKDLTVSDVHVHGGDDDEEAKRRRRRGKLPPKTPPGDPANEVALRGVFKAERVDTEKRQIFGGELVVDKQGDVIEPGVLEQGVYSYMLEHRGYGHMHRRMVKGGPIESMMFTMEKQRALGIDLGFEGWWVGFQIDDDAVWEAYKRGELPEFSIGGTCVPVPH
jgi:hypothetical protein